MKNMADGQWAEGGPWRTFFGISLIYRLTAQGRVGIEDASAMLNLSRSVLAGSAINAIECWLPRAARTQSNSIEFSTIRTDLLRNV